MLYSEKSAPKVIVTDLDGTLLDHHTYDWAEAQAALTRALSLNIPIVPCTSKTYAETRPLADAIGLAQCPIICENGSGIEFGDASRLNIAAPYASLLDRLQSLRAANGYAFRGFADLTVEEVAGLTSLPLAKAALAYKRSYSEPLVWDGSKGELSVFISEAANAGISIVRGGRFYHALDEGISKYNAVKQLLSQLGTPCANWVALGDGDNDIPLLTNADFAVVINNPTKHFPVLNRPHGTCLYTSAFGPTGWNRAINYILETFYG